MAIISGIGNFFIYPYQEGRPARYIAAFAAAAVNCGVFFFLMLSFEPLTTKPVELLGCFTYYHDLNITNRLAAVNLSLLCGLVSFQIFMTILSRLGPDEKEAHHVLGHCLLPLLVWLVSIAFGPQKELQFFWLLLSAGLCWTVMLYFPLMAKRSGSNGAASLVILSIALSFFLAPALMTGLKPLLLWLKNDQAAEILSRFARFFKNAYIFFPLFFALLGLVLKDYKTIFRLVIFPIEVVLLLFFAVIIPGVYSAGGETIRFFPAVKVFGFIVLPLFIVGVFDCGRRVFTNKKRPTLSPFPFLALLFSCFWGSDPIPGYNNLYEFGSRLPEYWMVHQGSATLFKDMYITYGLWDYFTYLLTDLSTDHFTAAACAFGFSLQKMIVLTAEFLALSAILPLAGAFLICFWAGVGGPSLPIIFFSVLLIPALLRRPVYWIAAWTLLSGIAPFARIPQGTMCVVASIPAFIWQAVVLSRSNRKTFFMVMGALALFSLLYFIGPLADYFWGLCRIFIETARVNSPWAANFWKIDRTPFLAVILGNALLIAPLMALAAGIVISKHGKGGHRHFVVFLLLTAVTLYALSSVSYGFSRVDSWAFRRQLQVLLVLLPVTLAALLAYVPDRRVFWSCITVIMIFMSMYSSPTIRRVSSIGYLKPPTHVFSDAFLLPKISASAIQDAGRFGLPHLGKGRFLRGHLEEEQATKAALDRFLAPGESFMDLTMEGLHYFSSQRPLLTEYPVYYVYPGDKPQFRAIEQLRRHNVRVSLLNPQIFDNSPSSLRAHYLYRFGLLNGLPLEITPKGTLLLPPEYFTKAGIPLPDKAEALSLLDKQFPQDDLKLLPVVWGRGYDVLAKKLETVRQLNSAEVVFNKTLPRYHYPVHPSIPGTKAGLLVMTVDMPPDKAYNMAVRWRDDQNDSPDNQLSLDARAGTLIIPLDSSPRWLLARRIESLDVSFNGPAIADEPAKLWSRSPYAPTGLALEKVKNARIVKDGEIEALNHDPMMFYTVPRFLVGCNLVIRVVMNAPSDVGRIQLFFKKPHDRYNEKDSRTVSMSRNRNDVYFYVPGEMTKTGEIRFDPGNVKGHYAISSLEAKSVFDFVPMSQELRKMLFDNASTSNHSLEIKSVFNARLENGNVLYAENMPAMVAYTLPKDFSGKNVLLRLVMDAPDGVDRSQLYFNTPSSRGNESDADGSPAVAGRNEIYFYIPALMTMNQKVLLSPGNVPGPYVIRSLDAKVIDFGEEDDERPLLPSITSAVLMQRPMVNELGLDVLGPWESME